MLDHIRVEYLPSVMFKLQVLCGVIVAMIGVHSTRMSLDNRTHRKSSLIENPRCQGETLRKISAKVNDVARLVHALEDRVNLLKTKRE